MKKTHAIAAVLLAALLSTTAIAGGAVHGVTITQVRIDNTGRGIITFSGPLGGAAAECGQALSYRNALAFNTATPAGQQILQVALQARDAQGNARTVDATGTGSCAIYGGAVEDLQSLVVH